MHNLLVKTKVYFGRPRPHYIIFVIKRARGQPRTPSMCSQFFETARTVRVQQHMREVNVYRVQVKWVVLRMCRARPSALIRGWVYFESCADAAVRETERNAETGLNTPKRKENLKSHHMTPLNLIILFQLSTNTVKCCWQVPYNIDTRYPERIQVVFFQIFK